MNKSRTFHIMSTCFVLLSCVLIFYFSGHSQSGNTPLSKTGFYFDTVIQITIYDKDKESCLQKCMELADKYEKMLSATIEGSDIWNINHSNGNPVVVSDETADLLNTALYYCELTGGRTDLTIESVSSLWDFHPDSDAVIPSDEDIAAALSHVDYHALATEGNTVTLKDPKAGINLGFIAKGFIADKMKDYLVSQNVESAMINLGGNILTIGSRPDSKPFKLGIQKPFDAHGSIITSLPVTDASLVSSGVYERYFYKDNVLYHHILDTSTGYPVQNELLGVTILSKSSTTGDALSTSCMILGLRDGMALIENTDEVEAVFITDDYKLHYTSGLKSAGQ